MGRPSDPVTGVKCFSIGGRMVDVLERCSGMTDEERRWRAQFLKDQVLSHDEPREVPELYKGTTNFFRRFWKTPMWKLTLFLRPLVGEKRAFSIRHFVGKSTLIFIGIWTSYYYLKFHSNNWCESKGFDIYITRGRMYPSDPGYPNFYEKSIEEYYDNGFSSSPLAKKIDKLPEVPSPPATLNKDGMTIVHVTN